MTRATDAAAHAAGPDGHSQFLQDVLDGLSRRHKAIPSKYLYDQHGSALFDEICELDEYYLTRTEIGIMEACAAEMADAIGDRCMLIEWGSGSSIKTPLLLDALEGVASYVPVDISREHLMQSADSLAAQYPDIDVHPICADFAAGHDVPAPDADVQRRVIYFPGSTIGNFTRPEQVKLLDRMARTVGPGGGALIGVDLKKDRQTLEAAYNDSRGVTAEFTLNLLRRLNRELAADFVIDDFAHVAEYNESDARIEIFLESRSRQRATIAGTTFDFEPGERIRTEYSHKFDLDEFERTALDVEFAGAHAWTDAKQQFAVMLLER